MWSIAIKTVSVATLLFSAVQLASAGMVFSNGLPDTNAPDARAIDIFRSADDFLLASPAIIDSIRFWMVAPSGEFQGTLTYAFHQNSAGAIGGLIESKTVSGITPVLLNQIPAFIHSIWLVDIALPAPLPLSAGTYWLEIHHGSSLTTGTAFPEVLWALVGGGVSGNAKQGAIPGLPSNSTFNELAFQLFDSGSNAVPEPATISISLAGLVATGLLRRHKA